VAGILQAMPLQARLQAALVCQAWADAAAAATHAEVALSPATWQHFQRWLGRCGGNLQHLAADYTEQMPENTLFWTPSAKLVVPSEHLSELVSLRLEGLKFSFTLHPPTHTPSGASADQSSFRAVSSSSRSGTRARPAAAAAAGGRWRVQLPQLQQLELSRCWMSLNSINQLSDISSLTRLHIKSMQFYLEEHCTRERLHLDDFSSAWARVLSGLRNLSVLEIERGVTRSGNNGVGCAWALKPVSSMQNLQRLSLVLSELRDSPFDVFALLPPSLTALQLHYAALHVRDTGATSGLVISAAAPQLSNLQQLDLQRVTVKASLLHSFPKLQRLVLMSVQLLAADAPHLRLQQQSQLQEAMQEGLAAIGQMAALQHLELVDLALDVCQDVVGLLSSLAASSQLTALHIRTYGKVLPAQGMQHMLPAGAQLPQLRVLQLARSQRVGSRRLTAAEVLGMACVDAAAVRRLAECCPGLRELQLWRLLRGSAAAGSLRRLTSLTSLTVADPPFHDAAAAAVAQLTGLRRLCWKHSQCPRVAQ
jgi:hypothetical protein